MLGRVILVVVAIVVVIGGALFLVAYRPAIAPLSEVQAASVFDVAVVARGEELAMIGNCTACHTAPGGEPLAGGVAVPTPFGTVYSTNITPEPQTGIGRWSEDAFRRAMHEGIDREGNHLYPAFPYDHYTHVTDNDIAALYAYLMTRTPVDFEPPANDLSFPFNLRPIVAGWNLLFLKQGPLPAVEGQSDEWNRGYYLAEGLGHCAACHTPRNGFGAEDAGRAYEGAPDIEGWVAYPIGATSPAPVPWTVDGMAHYLQRGFAEPHGVSRGPMTQVTANLAAATPEDVHAIATYIVSLMGDRAGAAASEPPAAPPLQSGDSQVLPELVEASGDVGAALYAGACASCHDAGRPQPLGGLDLERSTAIHAENPQNIVNMVLFGLPAPAGEPGPVMPGFAGAITEDQLVALLDYLRATYTDQPAWANARAIVADTMSGRTRPVIYSSDGVRRAVAPLTSARATP